MQRIQVDFNDLLTTEDVVVADLTTGYSRHGIEVLREGETVLLFEPDAFEVEGTLWFDGPRQRWCGKVNWSTQVELSTWMYIEETDSEEVLAFLRSHLDVLQERSGFRVDMTWAGDDEGTYRRGSAVALDRSYTQLLVRNRVPKPVQP